MRSVRTRFLQRREKNSESRGERRSERCHEVEMDDSGCAGEEERGGGCRERERERERGCRGKTGDGSRERAAASGEARSRRGGRRRERRFVGGACGSLRNEPPLPAPPPLRSTRDS